ncbi:MAG: desulfoferrodoxin [Clostridium sp.]|mgnify:CR=1 FL=1|nr:desulfoferrodoxin [Clostridium sp.]
MKERVSFYRCEICKNLVGLIYDGGGELVCCGQPMIKLEANTEDASTEKHVPVVSRKDGKIHVEVGSVAHPMVPEHYIEWIAVVSDDGTERISLTPEDKPEAVFCDKENVEVYAYCNIHGLWKAEL